MLPATPMIQQTVIVELRLTCAWVPPQKPGTAQTRTPAMKAAEETGGIGLLRNPLLNLASVCYSPAKITILDWEA